MFENIIADSRIDFVDWKLNLPWVQYGGEFNLQFSDDVTIIQDVVCMSEKVFAWSGQKSVYESYVNESNNILVNLPSRKEIALLKIKGVRLTETVEEPVYHAYDLEDINRYETLTCVKNYRQRQETKL